MMASLMGGVVGKAMGGDEGGMAMGLIPALMGRKRRRPAADAASSVAPASGGTILTDAMAKRAQP